MQTERHQLPGESISDYLARQLKLRRILDADSASAGPSPASVESITSIGIDLSSSFDGGSSSDFSGGGGDFGGGGSSSDF